MTRIMQYVAFSRVCNVHHLFIVGEFKPPLPLDNTSDLKVELDRLRNEKRLVTFEQPLEELVGIKIIFRNALSLHKYIGCVKIDKWFYGAEVLIFAETRAVPTDNVEINEFEIVHRSDKCNIGRNFHRGLIAYKKSNINNVAIVNKITHDSRTKNAEYVEHVDLVALKINDLFVIGGYRSPHASVGLFKQCMNCMFDACTTESNLVIIGDFNNDCYRNDVLWLEKYMNENRNLKRALAPGLPTTNLNTQIDVIFTNQIDYVAGTYESIISDHKPIYFCNNANKLMNRTLLDHSKSSKHIIPEPIYLNREIKFEPINNNKKKIMLKTNLRKK